MKKLFLIIGSLLLVAACKKDRGIGFELKGSIEGIPDSSEVILLINDRIIDSSIALNQEFKFHGKVGNPVLASLMIKNIKAETSFWLENENIKLTAQRGNLSNRKIVGSNTEKQAESLMIKISNLRNKSEGVITLFHSDSFSKFQKDSLLQVYKKIKNREEYEKHNFIKRHPNSMLSSHLLNSNKIKWGKDVCRELLLTLSKQNRNSDNGKSIARFIELNQKIDIDDKFVNFEQPNIKGKNIKVSDLNAEVLLIEFWASWCAPCREANPELRKVYKKYSSQGFEIIGVSLDHQRKNWIKAVEQDSLPWENVSDLKGSDNEAALIYGVNSIPENFLVDGSGRIIGRNLRGSQLTYMLESYFREKGNGY